MDPSSPVADITAFYIQEIGALLFGTVFLFLYRQSKVVYFGLWAVAWGCACWPRFSASNCCAPNTPGGWRRMPPSSSGSPSC
jgi:hypothetical protein